MLRLPRSWSFRASSLQGIEVLNGIHSAQYGSVGRRQEAYSPMVDEWG